MVWTTAYLAGTAPSRLGKSGIAAGLSWEHCLQSSRTRFCCLRTAHAGQSPGGRYLGAPGRAPRAH
eukprot:5583374-Alexandrium_andersonii.AAC.1